MYPTLITVFSILTGIILLTKIFLGLRFLKLKNKAPRNVFSSFILLLISTLLVWLPYSYSGGEQTMINYKKKINLVTYIFYGLVIILFTIIFYHIYNLRNG